MVTSWEMRFSEVFRWRFCFLVHEVFFGPGYAKHFSIFGDIFRELLLSSSSDFFRF